MRAEEIISDDCRVVGRGDGSDDNRGEGRGGGSGDCRYDDRRVGRGHDKGMIIAEGGGEGDGRDDDRGDCSDDGTVIAEEVLTAEAMTVMMAR